MLGITSTRDNHSPILENVDGDWTPHGNVELRKKDPVRVEHHHASALFEDITVRHQHIAVRIYSNATRIAELDMRITMTAKVSHDIACCRVHNNDAAMTPLSNVEQPSVLVHCNTIWQTDFLPACMQ